MSFGLILDSATERQHRVELSHLLAATKGPVRVASAYVTDEDLLLGAKGRRVQLLTAFEQMDIVSGATSLDCLRTLIDAGVQCSSLAARSRLHAKVYIFGNDAAVVTSANLTTNAFNSNIEVGVRFNGPTVHQLIAWFDANWKRASPLDENQIAELEEETEPLRRAFAALRSKVSSKRPFAAETRPLVRSEARLRTTAHGDRRTFVCNTDRLHDPEGHAESQMRWSYKAVAWTTFKFPSHMEQVQAGDAVFMWGKRRGVIAIGRAKGEVRKLGPYSRNRIRASYEKNEEWVIPIAEWEVWVEDPRDAYPWRMPNATFLDVSGEDYGPFREGVYNHFRSLR